MHTARTTRPTPRGTGRPTPRGTGRRTPRGTGRRDRRLVAGLLGAALAATALSPTPPPPVPTGVVAPDPTGVVAPEPGDVVAPEPGDVVAPEPADPAAPDPDDPATHGADHLVVAGAEDPGRGTDGGRFEYLAYYPQQLRVHRGDVVQFRLDQFHTVTFSDPEGPRTGFLRGDESGVVIQTDGALPSHDDCGTAAELPPCVFDDPTEHLNSGWNLGSPAFAGTLRLQFDVPPGAYTYYCTVHAGMQGTVEVVEDEEELLHWTEVRNDRLRQIAADTAAGEALKADPPAVPGPSVLDDGSREWTVQVGARTEDQRVEVLQFFPTGITVEPGDRVRFRVPDAGDPLPGWLEPVLEGHTVGIEPNPVREHDPVNPFIRYLVGMCDPDEVDGGLPGYVHPASFLVGCPVEGHTPEVAVNPMAFRHPDGLPYDDVPPGTYYDSGLLIADDAPCRITCDPYRPGELVTRQEVTARFPVVGEFGYRCFLHGAMDGVVSVGG